MSSVSKFKRLQVYERDNCVCHACASVTDDWEVHHIVPISDGGTNDIDNLQTLCHRCHVEVHRHDPPKNIADRCPTCNSKYLEVASTEPPLLRCGKCKATHPAIEAIRFVNANGKTKWIYGLIRGWSQTKGR